MNKSICRRVRGIKLSQALPLIAITALLVGCAVAGRKKLPPLQTVSHVDLARYMGHWRVIGEIPYFAERGAVDSVESYALLPDGTIYNWFLFRKGSFSAPVQKFTAHAYVINKTTNAEWRVKFLGGLISAPYLILDLDPNYQWTVVGHPSRNYGWIMAREKTMPDSTYNAILKRLAAQGYDPSRFQKVPQLPSEMPGH
jgi:apolipoprotein D and lipocalin family protein